MVSQAPGEKLIGLDSQKKYLEKIILNYTKTGRGASSILSGSRGSGKSTLLYSLLSKHFSNLKELLIEVDGEDPATLKEFTEQGFINKFDPDKVNGLRLQKIIVFRHFECLSTKQHQKFLYSALNGCQNNPWLVFLIGTTEHCISLLEKRIQSRLCKMRISFDVVLTREQLTKAFFEFLSTSMDSDSYQTLKNEYYDELGNSMKRFVTRYPSFGAIKKLAIVFGTLFPLRLADETPTKILEYSMDSIWQINDMAHLLRSISLRQLCLLRCLFMVQKGSRKTEVLCQEVIYEYKKLVNKYDRSMQVSSDCILCRDLDELISVGAIKLKNGTDIGQFEFRKIYLNVDKETVMACFRDRALPQKIDLWTKDEQ